MAYTMNENGEVIYIPDNQPDPNTYNNGQPYIYDASAQGYNNNPDNPYIYDSGQPANLSLPAFPSFDYNPETPFNPNDYQTQPQQPQFDSWFNSPAAALGIGQPPQQVPNWFDYNAQEATAQAPTLPDYPSWDELPSFDEVPQAQRNPPNLFTPDEFKSDGSVSSMYEQESQQPDYLTNRYGEPVSPWARAKYAQADDTNQGSGTSWAGPDNGVSGSFGSGSDWTGNSNAGSVAQFYGQESAANLPDLSKIGGNYGQDIFGNMIGGLNTAVGAGLQAASAAAKPIGETVNNLADSGIPGVSQAAQVGRFTYSNWSEPILSFVPSVAGELLKPAEYAARSVFDREGVTKELTAKKLQMEQQIYNQAIAAGYSEEAAAAEAKKLEGITNYNQLISYPMQVPSLIQNAGRVVFDRDNLTAEYRQKKTTFVQQAHDEVLASGGSEEQATKAAQVLDQKLNNFANLSEYEGLQKLGTLPALVQLGVMLGEPIGNVVGKAAAIPALNVAGKAAEKVGELPGVRTAINFVEGPQKRGYFFENTVSQLTPALERYAVETNQTFTDVAKQFANDPALRQGLGYTETADTAMLAKAMQEELDNAANTWTATSPGQPVPADLVAPENFAKEVTSNLNRQVGAEVIDKATGEVKTAKPLDQFGPVAATIGRGPGEVTNSFLARLWLNSPGRLIRDPATNIVKSVMEGKNPFGSAKTTAQVDSIGLQRPEFTEGLSGEYKKFGDNPVGNTAFAIANPQGELTSVGIKAASKLKVMGKENPLNLGNDINDTVGRWESSVKKNIWEQQAVQHFNSEANTAAKSLGKRYNVAPADVKLLLSNGKLTQFELTDFANKNLPIHQAGQFVKDVAAASADLRIQAGTFATKDMDRMFFSYKKNIVEQTLSGWAPFSYWPVQNIRWLAGYLAHNPYQISALSEFLDQNYEDNKKAGVPEYLRNSILLNQGKDGTQRMWNWQSSLPFALPNDQLTNAFATVASGDRDYSTSKKKNDFGSFVFGQETAGGGRDKGLIPSIYQLNPFLDIATQTGMVSAALRELNLTHDNFGSPGPREKQSLNLLPGSSVYASMAAALGWPLDMLRKAGFKVKDLNPEGPLNEMLFGPNAGLPVASVEKELALQVQNGQLTQTQAKQALISIKKGDWNPAALKALDNVKAEGLTGKILSFFGLPTTTANTPRDQYNDQIRQEYAKVRGDTGAFVTVEKTDPDTGRTYQTKEFRPGKVQEFFDKNPGADVLFASNKTADEIQQSLKDDATRNAITDLAKQRDAKVITLEDYYNQLDQLKAANPAYFEAQAQTKLDKVNREKSLLPGEDMPEILTPAQEKAQRQYNITTERYHNLTAGFDALQAKAYNLKDQGDESGYQRIVNSDEYRAAVKRQNNFIANNKQWFDQYQQKLIDEGFKTNTLDQRLYNEKLSDFKNLTPGFSELQDKAFAARAKGDNTAYSKIVSSPEYKDALARQNQFIKDNADWYAQYSKNTQISNTDRNAELVGGLARTNPLLTGKAPKTLEERKQAEKTDDYHSLSPGFEDLQKKAYALKDAGDTTGYKAIVSSPEYKDGQAKQLAYIEQNPAWFAQYQADLAKQGFTTKSLADRQYSATLDQYYSIGGDRFDQLSSQVNILMDTGNKKDAYKILNSPEYKQAKAAQRDFLNRNPDFAKRFEAEYRDKNGKGLPTDAEIAYSDKLNSYQEIGGEAFDFLSQQQQDLRNAGRTKEANAIFLSPAYQQAQAARDQYLKDNPDFAAQYFEKYPSAKEAFDKRQKQGYSSTTGSSSTSGSKSYSTTSYTTSYKPKVTYPNSYKPSTGYTKPTYSTTPTRATATAAGGDWTPEQKRVYAQALAAGQTKQQATDAANKKGINVKPTQNMSKSFNPDYTVKSYYNSVTKVLTPKATADEMQYRGWESTTFPKDFGGDPSARAWATYSAAKRAADSSMRERPEITTIVVWQPELNGYQLWSKAQSELTDQDQQLIAKQKDYRASGTTVPNLTSPTPARSFASLPPPQVFFTGFPSYPRTARKPAEKRAPIHKFLPSPNSSLIKFAGRKRY